MRVLEVAVLPEIKRITMTVQMTDPDKYLTSQVPHLPKLLFQLLPRLGKHTCHNEGGHSFRRECRCTEIPHVFEHLIIELQLQAQQDPCDFLSGETEWNWQVDPRGLYHVTVDYKYEVLALASIRLAERIICELDCKRTDIDIHSEIRRLRHILALSRLLEGDATTADPTAPQPDIDVNIKRPRRKVWDGLATSPLSAAA